VPLSKEVAAIAKGPADKTKAGDPRAERTIIGSGVVAHPVGQDPEVHRKGIEEGATLVAGGPGLQRRHLDELRYRLRENLRPSIKYSTGRESDLRWLIVTRDNDDSLPRSVTLQNAQSIRAVRLRAEKRAEAAVREQANLLNLTHDAIFVRDMNGTVKYWNRGAEELYGWPAAQAVGKVFRELLKTIFPVPLKQIEEEVVRTGRWEGELVQTKKDGNQVVVASRWSLQRDESGAHVAILVINNDITRRKRAEELARRSEKELRDVINAIPALVWSTLPDGAVDFVNDRWLEFTGLSPRDAQGWNWEATIHPDDRSTADAGWRAALKNGRPTNGEMRVRRADGEYRWWLFRNVPLHDETGNITKWYGTGIDIDDRKRAESLLAAEKRILEMVAKGDSLAGIFDSLCRLVEERAKGVLASVLLLDGDRLWHGGAPSLPKAYTDAINGAVIGPSAGSCGTAAYRREPVIVEDIATDPLWADYRDLALPHSLRACWSTPVFSSQGDVIATFAMYYREPRRPTQRDQEIIDQITHLTGIAIQKKLALERLQRSEAYLAEAEKLTHTGSWAWDPRTQTALYCSEEMFRILGLDPRESLPTRDNLMQQIHPEDRDWVAKRWKNSLRERVDTFDEFRVLMPDGTVRHINFSGHPVLDEDGQIIEFVGTAVDVTERKHAELERRRLASLVEQAADLMAIADLSGGTPIYLNKAGMKMVGFDSWEEARARRGIHYMFPEDRQFVNEVLWPTVLEQGSWSGEMRFRHFKTGEPIPILYSAFRIDDPKTGQPVSVGNVCSDITESKRAEDKLRASEQRLTDAQMELARVTRMTTLGELTASIAHEVNQPLAGVIANAEACLRWLDRGIPDLDAVRRSAQWVIADGYRASKVIRRVRALANKADLEKAPLDINDVVREVIALVQRELFSQKVSVRTEFAPALPMILGDGVQLQQVIINLVMNGIEAMQSVTDRPRELAIRSCQDETKQVLVSVTDCGVGISADNANRLFTAFFTTKSSGMGMGLSICRSIMEAHGGRLWATANTPHGATFQFTLPVNGGHFVVR
jgi:PAS domain S-box-containing protein